MKHKTTIAFAFALLGSLLVGCSNTAEGLKEDTEINSQEAKKKTREASENMGEAGRDLSAASRLTPLIKNAIIADPTLNNPDNAINVDSSEERVVLSGYVKTEEMKRIAGDIARRAIREKGERQILENNLVVRS